MARIALAHRTVVVAGMLMALVGCHHRGQALAPRTQPDSVVTRLIRITSDSAVDSSLAVRLRQARQRSYQAAAHIDTIIVRPDTIKLRVGQVAPFFTSVTIDARTASGSHVDSFGPLFEVGDQAIAGFSGPGIEGRKPGLTWLVVSAATNDAPNRKIVARSMVWILVEP